MAPRVIGYHVIRVGNLDREEATILAKTGSPVKHCNANVEHVRSFFVPSRLENFLCPGKLAILILRPAELHLKKTITNFNYI